MKEKNERKKLKTIPIKWSIALIMIISCCVWGGYRLYKHEKGQSATIS